jgi:hypothetical protein
MPSTRLALGLASLTAERLRMSTRTEETLAVAVGLVERAADRSRSLVRRWAGAPGRLAGTGARLAAELPGAGRLRSPAGRIRASAARVARDARWRGNVTIAAGRDDALALIKATVDDGLAWAQRQAVPRILDGAMPQLTSDVVPRIIEEAWPDIRERVLPMVIDDMVGEARMRELMEEQRRTVDRAVQRLRSEAESAGDTVESVVRRVLDGDDEPRPAENGKSPAPDDSGAPSASA